MQKGQHPRRAEKTEYSSIVALRRERTLLPRLSPLISFQSSACNILIDNLGSAKVAGV